MYDDEMKYATSRRRPRVTPRSVLLIKKNTRVPSVRVVLDLCGGHFISIEYIYSIIFQYYFEFRGVRFIYICLLDFRGVCYLSSV